MAVKSIPWKAVAIVSTATSIVLALLLPVCCYRLRLPFQPNQPPAARIPLFGTEPSPTPSGSATEAPTQTEKHDVVVNIGETPGPRIQQQTSEMVSKKAGTPVHCDNH